uniref:Uncharacterized protein n=1 Tax=Pinguiococcus pyrenoidosus TaxID=172671 RepID=A0A7R9YE35_9STRA|mmetsp:Transcript_502/g.1826  ORF Transcript_502/g.1826 Transcript_502/m.1826 type:complete len:100 (+) Transcript_502:1-300(+)
MPFTNKIELGEPQPPRGSVAGNEKVILPVGTFDGLKLPETAKAFWGSETLEATKTSSGDAYMVTTTPTTTAGPVRVILDFEVMESTTATFEYVKRLRRS